MPHLGEVWSDYKKENFTVLAISDEGKSTVQDFVENEGLAFPVASGGSKSFRAYGVRSYPTSYLVDHEGVLVWQGHPSSKEWTNMLPELLKKAKEADGSWDPGVRPDYLAKAVKLAGNNKLGSSWKETEKLLTKFAETPDKREQVEKFRSDFLEAAEKRVIRFRALFDSGSYFAAFNFVELQSKAYKGSPPGDQFAAQWKEWRGDSEFKKVMDLDEKRIAAVEMFRMGNDKKAIKDLKKLRGAASGTPVEDLIEADLRRFTWGD